jgi:hypothetical protein
MSVKVTLHLTLETAQRLGVESAMRRISQSDIAEEVLAAYLSRWQLPAVADSNHRNAGCDDGSRQHAVAAAELDAGCGSRPATRR